MTDYIEKKKITYFKRLENTLSTTISILNEINHNFHDLIKLNEELSRAGEAYELWRSKLKRK